MKPNKEILQQHYTPSHLAEKMVSLLQNSGKLLEPSAGDGALVRHVPTDRFSVTAIEVDFEQACHIRSDNLLVGDFFEHPTDFKYDSVLMNPPYMPQRKIPAQLKESKMFKFLESKLDGYANLYAYFILKSFLHLEEGGEMVVVVPADCFMVTGNAKLNTLLHNHGTFTNVIKFKDYPFKPTVTQPVVVWCWLKGDFSRLTEVEVV